VRRREQQQPRLGPGRRTGGADAVLRGGCVYRGCDERGQPRFAEAVALADGRITAVGTADEVTAVADAATVQVDLEGRTVVPGLIDSHLHLVRAGLTWSEETFWYEVDSLEAALGLLDVEAARRPRGAWLRVVGGWHPGQFAEGRGPTSAELTRRYPQHPVYVQLLYEEAVLNALALEACGITAASPDPPRGSFERDPQSGQPTGVVRGVGAFMHCLDRGPPPAFEQQVAGTGELMAALHRWGLTGGVDAGGLGMPPERYEALFALWRAGAMTLRTRLYAGPSTPGREWDEVTGWLRHAQPGFGDAWLRHVGVGELAVFGCHDLEGLAPFAVDAAARAELLRVATEVARRGWPLHMHAVLDATTSAVLDVWEEVATRHPLAGLRWSLAHVEPISTANLDRVRALGCGLAVQNRLVYRATDSARVWGDAAVRRGPPLQAIRARGIPLGAGTDATRVASPNPWVSLWWLVTGRTYDDGPERVAEQCLGRADALEAYTSGSAWFSFEEHERGHIAPGMRADLAVLADDYFTVADDDIRRLSADLTLVDGRAVHATGPFAGLDAPAAKIR
jgi:predicted amidohydrolase YtcJ